MAVCGISPALAIRSSVGIELWSSAGLKSPYEPDPQFTRDESKFCRNITFSKDGRFVAWTNGSHVRIINTENWKETCSLPLPKASDLNFSPLGNYLVTWELFTTNKDNPEGSPNLHVFKAETGEEVFKTIQRKQAGLKACWSSDESLFGLMIGGEALFYDLNNEDGFKTSPKRVGGGRNGLLSIAPGASPPFIALYVPGAKGVPSMCKIYKYPALQQNQTITCKSFFQIDNIEFMWNKRGTGLLLLTSTDVDQSGASYYGKQSVTFMTTKGDTFTVQAGDNSPVHAVAWSPTGNEFCVVYGYMPSKATLYNLKCDEIFSFGEGSRNCCYFNDFGNLLILAGFGNLRGHVEVWDMKKKVQIATLQAPDSTMLEWCPTGEIFVTATTAPRLRIGNGFKIWHYSGALLYEYVWPKDQELLEVRWQKYKEGVIEENIISNVKIEGIAPAVAETRKKYEPPNVRLMREGKLTGNGDVPLSSPIPGLPPGYKSKKTTSSNSNRQQKPRNNRRDKQAGDMQSTGRQDTNIRNGDNEKYSNVPQECSNEKQKNSIDSNVQNVQKPRRPPRNDRFSNSTGDPEKDKKIRAINKKLQDITKLKARQRKGEHLEANQLTKMAAEHVLVEELKTLRL